MRRDRSVDDRVDRFLLGDFLDVQIFLIADVECGANLGNHVSNRNFLRRRASAFLAGSRFQLYGASALDLALKFHSGLEDFGLANLPHQVGHATLLDELRADILCERSKLLALGRIG
jgi:hypothetical protein